MKNKIRKVLDEIYDEYKLYLLEDFGEEILLELTEIFMETRYEITKETVLPELINGYIARMQ